MGPLVPEIFSAEFNLVIALIIGVAFGFILEQAGFSSTKKLVGLFYGYDFTVLRVFFTAGTVALIGVILFSHFGLLNMDLIYINPTFLRAALVGGGIMGVGFIIGGFCPGTSICAAAIGKIDAMAFVLGAGIGIFIFAEFFPFFEETYKMQNMGALRIDQYFSISPELFGFIFTVIAIASFYLVTLIENKVNKIETDYSKNTIVKYSVSIFLPIFILLIVGLTPDSEEYLSNEVTKALNDKNFSYKTIVPDKLAGNLVNKYTEINFIDVRSKNKYKKYHLPLAINIPLEDMKKPEFKTFFNQFQKQNIFYADNDSLVKSAFILAEIIGESENLVLTETMDSFKNKFFNLKKPSATASDKELELYRFRNEMAKELLNLDEKFKKFKQAVKKKAKKITGGCS